MTKKTYFPFKLLFLSVIGSVITLLISCIIWTDFKIEEVANNMFWVGTLVIIIGGSNFFPSNITRGQSEASMFSLRFSSGSDPTGAIQRKEREITHRSINGVLIALPGLVFVVIALFLLNN